MSGIPGGLLRRLREALVTCGPFQSDEQLQSIFVHELIRPWRYHVPQAGNPLDRVDKLIAFLLEKRRAEIQTSALVLFVEILRDRADPHDSCYVQLTDLARELDIALQIPAGASTPPPTTPEANPENRHMIFTAEWLKVLESVQAVGRVSVPQIIYDQTSHRFSSGTGWLIAPELVLTCRHVIAARGQYDSPVDQKDFLQQAVHSVITFDYLHPGQGIEYRVASLECDDESLDYALLHLEDRADAPLAQLSFLKLDIDIPLTLQTALYVIQHPKGQPQQSASGMFIRQKEHQPARFFHSAPTEPGTSGAPVLNMTNWRVAALHNGENEKAHLREATLIRAILSHIQQQRPDLHALLIDAQQHPSKG